MDPKQLEALENEQERDHKTVTEAIAAAEKRIASLNPDLKPDILAEQARQIREQALKDTAERRNRMVDRGALAQQSLPHHTAESYRRRARFHDDPVTDATMRVAKQGTLSRTSTPELLAHLQDAVAANDLASAEATRLEFQSRNDRGPEIQKRFETIFAELKLPQAAEAQRALNRVTGLAGVVNSSLAELVRGHSDPMARLAAHRVAGRPRAA